MSLTKSNKLNVGEMNRLIVHKTPKTSRTASNETTILPGTAVTQPKALKKSSVLKSKIKFRSTAPKIAKDTLSSSVSIIAASTSSSDTSKNTTSSSPAASSTTQMGNIVRTAPGWTQDIPPTRGNLIFDASFESGNLHQVNMINDCEYELMIRGDSKSPKYRVWFYFSAENVRNNQRVVFHLSNYTKMTTLFEQGYAAPVVRSSKQPKWRRIPERQVHHQPDRNKSVLTFWHLFDDTKSVYEFALGFPYTYTRLQRYLTPLCRKQQIIKRELLTYTVQNRMVDLLVIGDNVKNGNDSTKPVIVITARVHPGETNSSIVCQGLIDFLTSDQPPAVRLRQIYTFKIIPMLNPDGVCLGNYRCSSVGVDLNRQWSEPKAASHPSIYATKRLLLDCNNNLDNNIVMYLDIHGHTQRTGAFIYGNIYDQDHEKCHKQFVFPQLLANLATDFDMSATQLDKNLSKETTSRRFVCELHYYMSTFLDGQRYVHNQGFCRAAASGHFMLHPGDLSLGANVGQAILQFAQVQMGERVCTLQPMRTRTLNNQTVVVTKRIPPAKQSSVPGASKPAKRTRGALTAS